MERKIVNIIDLIPEHPNRIVLPKGSPQHWTSCLIRGRVYLIMNTWRTRRGVVWQLECEHNARVDDYVARPTMPQKIYFHDASIDVLADWA
jgi:hypothetical protein